MNWLLMGARPDVAYAMAMLSQRRVNDLKEGDYKLVNSAMMHVRHYDCALMFPRIDITWTKICGYAEAAFENTQERSSQVGILIIL